MSNTQVGSDFEIHKGYIKGFASIGGLHTSKTDSAKFEAIKNGYFAQCFLVNYDNQADDVEIDYIKVTEFA